MASAEGGVEIEEVARVNPAAIHRLAAHPHLGLLDWQARQLAFAVGLGGPHLRDFVVIARGLVATMLANDADLVEVNPLAVVREAGPDGTAVERLACLDAKITLDDSALFRHPELEALRDLDEEDPVDRQAREEGINFIKLDGSIGCMVNGAGLAMTTMDLVKRAGGQPANFLDIGGGARADKVAAAMALILADPQVTAILVNIFGGITRGDEVARGLIEARAVQARDVPMVVRIVGTNADEAAALLEANHFATATSLDDAAAKAVAAGRSRAAAPMSILVGRETRLVVQGITGREGEFHSRAMLEYGTPLVAGVTPNKGGQRVIDGRVPVFNTVADAVRETGANTSCIYVPAAGAPDAILEAVGAGIATIFCITEGIPALDMLKVVEVVRAAGARLIGPNCPGRHVAWPGQGRDHPRLGPSRGQRGRRVALGDADVRGRPGDDRRRDRPVDLRRDRRRPDHRHDLPGRPPAVRRGPRDRRDRADRGNRRFGRGGGGGMGRRTPPGHADGRVHCRPDGTRRSSDGSRGGNHLGRLGQRRRQDRGARSGGNPGGRIADRDPGPPAGRRPPSLIAN